MRILFLAMLALALAAGPGHAGDISGEYKTLSDKLFFNKKAHKARIPPLPEGQIRLKAPLTSMYAKLGMHYYADTSWTGTKYCTFVDSRFGVMGRQKGEGNLWFFADIDAETGKVLKVYVYGRGACGSSPYDTAFLLSKKLDGSYGNADSADFTIQARGKGVMSPQREGADKMARDDFAIKITGAKDLLTARDGAKIPVKFYFSQLEYGLKADGDFPNQDKGYGTAILERNAPIPQMKTPAGIGGGARITHVEEQTPPPAQPVGKPASNAQEDGEVDLPDDNLEAKPAAPEPGPEPPSVMGVKPALQAEPPKREDKPLLEERTEPREASAKASEPKKPYTIVID